MRRISLAVIAFCCLSVMSCGGDREKGPAGTSSLPALITANEVRTVYDKYVRGDYEGYVAEMASCDGKPVAYKRQMSILYKQHAADQRKDDGDVTALNVIRIEPQAGNRAALAYVSATYANGKSEELLLQFVYLDGRWRLR